MQTHQIRELIDGALAQEAEEGAYAQVLSGRLPELRQNLVMPDEEPVEALLRFVQRYIRSVPSCLRLVTAVSKRQGFYDYAAPFLRLAQDYFLQPPEAVVGATGMEALLDEAFLAHRLLEEINDHHIRHLQRPLLPLDMTEANIIVHHLLGDAFALRLEQLVAMTAQDLLRHEHLWESVKAQSAPGYSAMELPMELEPETEGIRLRLAS